MNQHLTFGARTSAKLLLAVDSALGVPPALETARDRARGTFAECLANLHDPLTSYAALAIAEDLAAQMGAADLKLSVTAVSDAYGVVPEVAIFALRLCGCVKEKRDVWVTNPAVACDLWAPETVTSEDLFVDFFLDEEE